MCSGWAQEKNPTFVPPRLSVSLVFVVVGDTPCVHVIMRSNQLAIGGRSRRYGRGYEHLLRKSWDVQGKSAFFFLVETFNSLPTLDLKV